MDNFQQVCENETAFRMWVVINLTEVRSALNSSAERQADHEIRLRTVEKKVWFVAGAGALLGAIISPVFTVLSRFVGR